MGDMYINNGQAGAMGKKAAAFQNTFNQEDRKTLEKLSELDITNLRELMNKIIAYDGVELQKQEALRGAACLAELIEASQNKMVEVQGEAIGKWQLWLSGLKESSLRFLAVIADILTVSLPLLKLLGLSTL
ncbi:hypothetical protein HQN89_21885 [Paenibacillus frigoriresistens]|uniref:hypothetical protein n=1 Tax=Paenibacillus alginolyticus TaxID=59839 RepID=UPI001566F10C|nr:hypothetical protein [Paenibacillus frigoriresistens]NRF93598.1 hypothetical protein [Paenibacillus frigoriresistens]